MMTITLSDEKKDELLGKLAQDLWNDHVRPIANKYKIGGDDMIDFLSLFVSGVLVCFVKPESFDMAIADIYDRVEFLLTEIIESGRLGDFIDYGPTQ